MDYSWMPGTELRKDMLVLFDNGTADQIANDPTVNEVHPDCFWLEFKGVRKSSPGWFSGILVLKT